MKSPIHQSANPVEAAHDRIKRLSETQASFILRILLIANHVPLNVMKMALDLSDTIETRDEIRVEEKKEIVTDDEFKIMVDRFLCWKLPENFRPDHGVSFKDPYPHLPGQWPTGTNLFDGQQAALMIRYMLDGIKR